MNLILASSLGLSFKNEQGEKVPQQFANENQILDNIKKLTPKYNNFVFVASDENNYDVTDIYANVAFESFKMTLPFNNYTLLDGRTKDRAKEIIETADLILLCGGHVPTQNKFFENINLREIIRNTTALIIGVSAGSMNLSDVVYAQPELEGETLDANYRKYLRGLGLTNISILPHFDECIEGELDNKKILEDICLPDSKVRPFIAYSDGAYILDNGQKQTMYGSAYLFEKGSFQQISEDNSVTDITDLVSKTFKSDNVLEIE